MFLNIFALWAYLAKCETHRRRIKTEVKAKVIAAAWGAELIQFLAMLLLANLHQNDIKNRMNSPWSSNHPDS